MLIASVDLHWVYAIDLATVRRVARLPWRWMRAVPPPPAADRPSLMSIVTGLRYAKSRPELLGTYLVDINAMFFGMPQALYPFMAQRLGGPAVLGAARRPGLSARSWPPDLGAGPAGSTGTG